MLTHMNYGIELPENSTVKQSSRKSRPITSSDQKSDKLALIPIPWKGKVDLITCIALLETLMKGNELFHNLVQRYQRSYMDEGASSDAECLVVLAKSKNDVLNEIGQVRHWLLSADMSTNFRQSTVSGSCLSKGKKSPGKLAFVYPPFGVNSKSDLQAFTRAFPELLDRADEVKKYKIPTLDVILAVCANAVLTEKFGVNPDVLLGCSYGEFAMAIASEFLLFEETADTPKIQASLFDIQAILKDETTPQKNLDLDSITWASYHIKYDLNLLQKILKKFSQIYITVIGSHKDVIVAGDLAQCKQLIADTGCMAIRVYDQSYAHTPIVEKSFDKVKSVLDSLPTALNGNQALNVYSTSEMAVARDDLDSYNNNIAKTICQQVDFRGLVRTAYADGVRYFIDVGGKGFCANWMSSSFEGNEAVVLSVNQPGKTLYDSVITILATLIADGYSVDLSSLFSVSSANSAQSENALNNIQKVTTIEKWEHFEDMAAVHNRYLRLQHKYQVALLDKFTNIPGGKLPRLSFPKSTRNVLWGYEQLVELSQGSIERVLGPEYREISECPLRLRMAAPPFMFVTRVTEICAQWKKLVPATICLEYQIPEKPFYFRNGVASTIYLSEIGQCGILLLSYMGVDLMFEKHMHYRVIENRKTQYISFAANPGDALSCNFSINSFDVLGDKVLLDYVLDIFFQGSRVYTSTGKAGLFSTEDLSNSKGILNSDSVDLSRDVVKFRLPSDFCAKRRFGKEELDALQKGDGRKCFDNSYESHGLAHQLYPPDLKMIDSVSEVQPNGGEFGLGFLKGEKEILPEHWAFQVHFKNDPVFPASLIYESGRQLAVFYLTFLKLRNIEKSSIPNEQHIPGETCSCVYRGQIEKAKCSLNFELTIISLCSSPVELRYNLDVIHDSKVIMVFHNASLRLT